jgi:hypothetical protein
LVNSSQKLHDTAGDDLRLIGAEHVPRVGDNLSFDVRNELPRAIDRRLGIVQDFSVANEQEHWHFEFSEFIIVECRPEGNPRAEVHCANDQLFSFQIIGVIPFDR